MKIWIDADACPVVIREIIYKAAERLKINTLLVANQTLKYPKSPLISFVLVTKGFDVADTYIVQNLAANDLVITADIPLADLVVKKGGVAISPRGELYDQNSISEKLSYRNFNQLLREGGLIQGGAAQMQVTDKHKFAAMFDKQITILMKRSS